MVLLHLLKIKLKLQPPLELVLQSELALMQIIMKGLQFLVEQLRQPWKLPLVLIKLKPKLQPKLMPMLMPIHQHLE